ncbi:MAG: 4-vinyl reductase [Chloroflexota bacterium]
MLQKSDLYYPNKIARIYLMSLEEVMGASGINAVLNLAQLPNLIGNYPPNNLAREFDFADFSAINQSLEDMYGPRGGRGLGLRAGRAAFAYGLSEFGSVIGVSELAFKVVPMTTKVKIGLKAMADTFSRFSDQETDVIEEDEKFVYTIYKDPLSWGRTSDHPVGYGAVGILQEGLHWVSGGKNFRVEQVQCKSMGHENSVFHIYKQPLDF